jgi:hypothetical protein
MENNKVKTSGKMQEFNTGAHRDTQENKGRFDLIPSFTMEVLAITYAKFGKISNGVKLSDISKAMGLLYRCINKDNINPIGDAAKAVWYILEHIENQSGNKLKYEGNNNEKFRFDLIPYIAIKRVASIFEQGAELYGERNWENGFPLQRFLDSAIRHLFQYISGIKDEDHGAQCVWNIMGFIETLYRINQGYLLDNLDNRLLLKKISKDKDDISEMNNVERISHHLDLEDEELETYKKITSMGK